MRPLTLGFGLVIAAVAGGAMMLSGGIEPTDGASLDDRAGRVVGTRGSRQAQGLESAGPRSMFRSVETWGGRQRDVLAAPPPSRLDPEDRNRSDRPQRAGSATRTPQQRGDRVGASNRRPIDNAARDRLREVREREAENRAKQREMDAQQRRLALQQERMRRLEEARLRQTRGITSNGVVNAQSIRAAAAAREAGLAGPGDSAGEGGEGDGAPRDPNAPPSMEEIMELFDAFGIDPTSGGSTTGGRSGSGGSRSGSSSGGSSGSRSGSGSSSGGGNTGGGTSGVGGGGFTTTGNLTIGLDAAVSTVWVPVDQATCAEETAGLRTNDLFVRIEITSTNGTPIPDSVGIFTLNFPGVEIEGGAYNDPDGTLAIPPTINGQSAEPCAFFDTFIAFGDTSGTLLENPGFEDPLVSRIDAALLSSAGAVPATRDRSILGDDAFYLRIARISAPTTITDLTGSVDVGILLGADFGSFANAESVPITFEPSLWRSLEGLQAFWIPVEIGDTSDCDPGVAAKLMGVDSFDLFLRRDQAFDLVFVSALDGEGTQPLELSSGLYYFHVLHDPDDQKPTSEDIALNPCLAFDSFLTVDTSASPVEPRAAIISSDWTSTSLTAFWGVPNLGMIDTASPEPALQDSSEFGDEGYYVRVARVSVEKGSEISGQLLVSWVAVLPGDVRLPVVSQVPVCDFALGSCP